MDIFEAGYPFLLQQVIDHARRFVLLLPSADASTQSEPARVWLTGRATEIETVLAALVTDWRSGQLSERAAARAIASYLSAMHAAGEQHLGTGAEEACCEADAATTIPQTPFGGAREGATADTLPGCPGAFSGVHGAARSSQ
jgi:hypothetical protein